LASPFWSHLALLSWFIHFWWHESFEHVRY
jgi:hypothetical protein